ncbi:serine/threonine-protein kinase D3-like [Haemaphysalis longicornis]
MQRHLQACSKRQVALESTDLTKDAKRGTAKARNVTFLMQAGVVREMVTIDSTNANIDSLKEVACNMILTKLPQHGLSRLQERLILFRHDYGNANILLPVTSAADVTEGCLVEAVISGKYKRFLHEK